MARALAAAALGALLAVSGAGGSGSQQTPRSGGSVVFGPMSEPACLNPLLRCDTGNGRYYWILAKVLPGAFAIGPDFRWHPMLVAGASFTAHAPYTVTYHIRSDARWSDGVPVTARDFVFTHRAMLAHGCCGAADLERLVRSISIVDPKTFRVTLPRGRVQLYGAADWHLLFGSVLPQHVLEGRDLARIWTDSMDDPRTGRPIGSGPFLVGGWERGRRLSLVRNPRHWGPHPAYLERLILRFCRGVCPTAPPPAEAVERLRSGAVDFTQVEDTVALHGLRRLPDTAVRALRSYGFEQLTLRLGPGGSPALRSAFVRRAIAYGLDRGRMARELWGAISPNYRPVQSAVLLGTARGYTPNWRRYRYRPALARRLLERAGCRRGADGIYVCAGERLSLRFSTITGLRERERSLRLMQASLRRAGIEAVPSYVADHETFFGKIASKGKFDAIEFAFGWPAFLDLAGGEADIYGCGGPTNFSGYCDRAVTASLVKTTTILDDARRARLLNRTDRELAEDVPTIPLYQLPWVIAYKKSIRDVEPSPDNLLWNAENWWLEG